MDKEIGRMVRPVWIGGVVGLVPAGVLLWVALTSVDPTNLILSTTVIGLATVVGMIVMITVIYMTARREDLPADTTRPFWRLFAAMWGRYRYILMVLAFLTPITIVDQIITRPALFACLSPLTAVCEMTAGGVPLQIIEQAWTMVFAWVVAAAAPGAVVLLRRPP